MKIWRVLSLSLLQKIEKACSRENIKGIAEQSLDKEIMAVSPGSNQPFQQRPGKGQNGGRLLNFWDSTEEMTELFSVNMPYLSRKGKNDPEGDSETGRAATPTGSLSFSRTGCPGPQGWSCSLEPGQGELGVGPLLQWA